ncbi:MAG: hypothetical protein U0790_12555 [Isosphaeraceae bacterium]
MDHFVTLDRWPDGLELPADLKERIQFDPQSRRLSYHGYMSKSEFDRISGLTRDWPFRRKLEELFQLSVFEGKEEPKKGHGLLSLFRRRAVPG